MPPAEPDILDVGEVDLEPVREELESYDSGRNGGRSPKDPVAMLRSIILMAMKGETSFNKWVPRGVYRCDWDRGAVLFCGVWMIQRGVSKRAVHKWSRLALGKTKNGERRMDNPTEHYVQFKLE